VQRPWPGSNWATGLGKACSEARSPEAEYKREHRKNCTAGGVGSVEGRFVGFVQGVGARRVRSSVEGKHRHRLLLILLVLLVLLIRIPVLFLIPLLPLLLLGRFLRPSLSRSARLSARECDAT